MRQLSIEENPRITALHTFFRQSFSPKYKFHGETHDFYELVCVTDGNVSVAADSNIFSLKKGQLLLHPPMQFHNICNLDNSSATVIVFTFSGEQIPDLNGRVCDISDLSQVKAMYEMADRYYSRDWIWVNGFKDSTSEHFRFIKELELFLTSLSEGISTGSVKPTQGALNYSMIMKTIEEHMYERLTVSRLASLCSMSEINLQKTFSTYAGVGVIEYCKRIQMHKAAELLREGRSVKETALELGYTDQNYFSTVFKRVTGHTPSEIRKRA